MPFRSTLRHLAGALVAVCLATPVFAGDYRDGPEQLPWQGSTKDGYPVPQPPPAYDRPHSYKDDAPPPRPRRVAECLSKYGIRSVLNRQGWHAFDDVENRGPVTFMTARADGGRPFEVQFDSCSGEVIEAHPIAVYREAPPPVYYAPRPAVGIYFGGGYGPHRHWR